MLHHVDSSCRLRLKTAVKLVLSNLLAAGLLPLQQQLLLRIPLPALITAIVQRLCLVCNMKKKHDVSTKD